MTTLSFDQTLTTLECANCYMTFAIPGRFMEDRRNDHSTFYCPRGHHNHYPQKSEVEKLREKLETERKSAEFWRKQEQTQREYREHAERQRDAYKGHNTRLKKRVAKGKCPCCSMQFVNLRSHMAKRHPDYVEEPGAEVQAQAD